MKPNDPKLLIHAAIDGEFDAAGAIEWEFVEHGLMQRRFASINNMPIKEDERKYHWPPGSRPTGHPGLSELGL